MNALSICGAGSGLKIEGDLYGSIRTIYEGEKTQGTLVQDVIAKVLLAIPEDQRLLAYNAYLGCVEKTLKSQSSSSSIISNGADRTADDVQRGEKSTTGER